MAFVPEYKYDVFVSFAHVDDQPDEGVKKGWVSTLINGLEIRLAQKLGRREMCFIWQDYRLSSHVPLTDAIIEIVKNSATIILVLSPGYLASSWCVEELKAFLKAVRQSPSPESRVFIVERDRVLDNMRPEELNDLRGYQFWIQEKNCKHTKILGDPTPNPLNPNHQPYYDQLGDLSNELATELERLKSLTESMAPEPPEVVKPDTRPAVFLAEVTDDLILLHDEVKRYLDQEGIRTLPQGCLYFVKPDDFDQTVNRDLKDCNLFVQLLSEIVGRKPSASQTYSRIQYERALQAGIPIFQWRDPSLKLDDVTDVEHRKLLECDTVLAMRLEEFKNELVKQVFRKPIEHSRPQNAFVFMNVGSEDNSLAQSICKVIVDKYGMVCAMPLQKGDPMEMMQDLEDNLTECDGVIIVYGAVTARWARNQWRQCRKIRSKRKRPLTALAVYEGPPEQKDPLDIHGVMVINCRQCLVEERLQPFFDALRPGGAQ